MILKPLRKNAPLKKVARRARVLAEAARVRHEKERNSSNPHNLLSLLENAHYLGEVADHLERLAKIKPEQP
mgnify:CR=1 FL=1|tara:strand:+ start:1368 stop:1580 length:213 start_codon:yes stop_codon:yes gene_type:complete